MYFSDSLTRKQKPTLVLLVCALLGAIQACSSTPAPTNDAMVATNDSSVQIADSGSTVVDSARATDSATTLDTSVTNTTDVAQRDATQGDATQSDAATQADGSTPVTGDAGALTMSASFEENTVLDDVTDGLAAVSIGIVRLQWSSTGTTTGLFVPTSAGPHASCAAITEWTSLAGFSSTASSGEFRPSVNDTRNDCWRITAQRGAARIDHVFQVRFRPAVTLVLTGGAIARAGGSIQAIAAWSGAATGEVDGHFLDSAGAPVGDSFTLCGPMASGTCKWTYTAGQVPASGARLRVTARAADSEGDVGSRVATILVND